MSVFRLFESLLDPTSLPPDAPPPGGLGAFYWHYVRQVRHLVVGLFVAGSIVALLDTTVPVFIGRLIALVSNHQPGTFLHEAGPQLALMAFVLLIARPAANALQQLVTNHRDQSRLHQPHSLAESLARGAPELDLLPERFRRPHRQPRHADGPVLARKRGRRDERGLVHPDLRHHARSCCSVRATSASQCRWCCGSAAMRVTLRYFVPRVRVRSRRMSEARSNLTGRIVDSYTNILTVKLFARPRDEDAFVRDAVDDHTDAFRQQLRIITMFGITLSVFNAALLVGVGTIGVWLWVDGRISVGALATALPLAWQISNIAGLGGAERDLDLRECRHRAGRHALDRRAAADAGSRRRIGASGSSTAPCASMTCASAMARCAACCTASTSRSRRASGSASSGPRAPANRRWSICCCAFTRSSAAAS